MKISRIPVTGRKASVSRGAHPVSLLPKSLPAVPLATHQGSTPANNSTGRPITPTEASNAGLFKSALGASDDI